MKQRYKLLYIICLFILPFLFISNAKADYQATVINNDGANCSLYKNSTGHCLYKDKNLNSYNSGAIWLDTGDTVTVITSSAEIKSNNSTCPSSYLYVKFPYNGNTYYGYYCGTYLSKSALNDEFKKEFKDAGFPESYWEKLAILKSAHSNWVFKKIDTGLKFSDAVINQTYGSRALLRKSMSNNYAYLSLDTDSFDYVNDCFITYDDTTGSNPWYKANYDTIAYYMDPRNFLSDMYIFQFETLSYDNSVSDDKLKSSINSIFGDDYLNKFTDKFVIAGKTSLVNPIYLASLSKEEIANGSTAGTAINGLYNKMYNFYNIGATDGSNPVYRGLDFAAGTDDRTLRPWNTEERAITGGAIWIFDNYVAPGQDTSYFKKYNVVYNYLKSINREPTYDNYAHQYMQNIAAPSSEAVTTYRSYYSNNMLGLSYTFYIPVYSDMPAITSLPTKGGWPNNYLKGITLNDNQIIGFSSEVTTYNYNLDINNPKLKIGATAKNSTAKIEGTGTFDIKENTTKTIKVTAQNGDVRNYVINIKLTGTKLENPIDVKTTLNNAGIKNNDKYLYGFNVGSNISIIKEKILSSNKSAVVTLRDSSGKEKNSGMVATGDVVVITVQNETKTYKVVVYGDVNGNGNIDNIDFIRVKKHLLNTTTLSGPYKEAADINKNGDIDNIDFIRLKKYLLGDNSIIVQ